MAQSVSICVPAAGRCINNCKTCCSKMHPAEYENRYHDNMMNHMRYIRDIKERMEYSREKGCDVAILTGSTEPQQDRQFLKEFWLVNESLKNPFRNIEIQTTGATIDRDMLKFFRELGVQTVAISLFCLNDDEVNRSIIGTCDKDLNLQNLCKEIKEEGMNIRLCLNITDHIMANGNDDPNSIFGKCSEYVADQVTFRKMWAPDNTSEQGSWIQEHCMRSDEIITKIKEEIKKNGEYLNTLEYGAKRYGYQGFSTVIDEDSMSKDQNNGAIKYYVIRQNGKMYSNWDSRASLIF